MIGIDETKRINIGNSNTGMLRPEDLTKMFPTPPSLEHHPNSSPSGGSDVPMTEIETPKIKQEIYPNLGSPTSEQIEVIKSQIDNTFDY